MILARRRWRVFAPVTTLQAMRFAWVLALVLAACETPTTKGSPGTTSPNLDAAVFQECTTVCWRPSDCAVAYSSDDICPPGFLCGLRFRCIPDGGGGD
jgi:hypothetical protein